MADFKANDAAGREILENNILREAALLAFGVVPIARVMRTDQYELRVMLRGAGVEVIHLQTRMEVTVLGEKKIIWLGYGVTSQTLAVFVPPKTSGGLKWT